MGMMCGEAHQSSTLTQPQAAYAALTKSLQFEWAYLQRVTPRCSDAFVPLRDTINIPPRGSISEQEKVLFSLPARKGGLGIRDPVESANVAYSAAQESTVKIVSAIKGDEEFSVQEYREKLAKSHSSCVWNRTRTIRFGLKYPWSLWRKKKAYNHESG